MKKIISISMVLALICATFTSCKRTENEVNPSKSATTVHKPQNGTLSTEDNPKRVKGSIRKPSHAAIVNAGVAIYDVSDEIITTVYSDTSGAFVTDSIAPGYYYAVITATGYQQGVVDFTLNNDGIDYDLGDIYLEE